MKSRLTKSSKIEHALSWSTKSADFVVCLTSLLVCQPSPSIHWLRLGTLSKSVGCQKSHNLPNCCFVANCRVRTRFCTCQVVFSFHPTFVSVGAYSFLCMWWLLHCVSVSLTVCVHMSLCHFFRCFRVLRCLWYQFSSAW